MPKNKSEVSEVTPPVATGTSAATEEALEANTQVDPANTAAEVVESEAKDNEAKVEERKAGAEEVTPTKGDSPEEKAAKRAGVPEERMTGARIGRVVEKDADGKEVVVDEGHEGVQNRNPRNQFEKENQKVTEQERKAAQERSNMSTEKRVETAETPAEVAQKDAANTAAVNQGSEIASAIAAGLKDAKGDNFKLQADAGVEPRFSLVKNKNTGEVLLRENETGHLSQLQLKSIEEKEASVQDQDVEEL